MTTAKNTIDKTTTVNLGILIVLMTGVTGGAMYLGSLKTSVDNMARGLVDVRDAIDANTRQIMSDGKHLAAMDAQLAAMLKRLETLEENGK